VGLAVLVSMVEAAGVAVRPLPRPYRLVLDLLAEAASSSWSHITRSTPWQTGAFAQLEYSQQLGNWYRVK
jgi:hypothetical protein